MKIIRHNESRQRHAGDEHRYTGGPLPSTVSEKLEAALGLKSQGNDCFSQGDFKGAVKHYKKVFLYMNGLHSKDSEMHGFFKTMGAEDKWDQGDQTNKISMPGQHGQIKTVKIETSNNIALAYVKLNQHEKVRM